MHICILFFGLKQKKKPSVWIPTCSELPWQWSFKSNYTVLSEKRCYNFYIFPIASKVTLALCKLAFASLCNTQASTMLAFLHFMPLDVKITPLCNGHSLFLFFFSPLKITERERGIKSNFSFPHVVNPDVRLFVVI